MRKSLQRHLWSANAQLATRRLERHGRDGLSGTQGTMASPWQPFLSVVLRCSTLVGFCQDLTKQAVGLSVVSHGGDGSVMLMCVEIYIQSLLLCL